MVTQFSLMDYEPNSGETKPYPERVVEDLGGTMAYLNTNTGKRLYSVRDWVYVVSGSKNKQRHVPWANLKSKLAMQSPKVVEKINTLSVDTAGGAQEMDFADAFLLYEITMRMDDKSSAVRKVKSWLAGWGVIGDHIQRTGELPAETPVRQSKEFRKHLDANYTPALAERAIDTKHQAQDSHKAITSEWSQRGAKGQDYGRLTNDVTEAATGRTVKQWRDQYGIKGTPRQYFSAAKNAALDWVQRVAAGLHQDNDSHGVDALERDIEKAGSVLDQVNLRKLFPDMDLDTPSVPPEQKSLTSGEDE